MVSRSINHLRARLELKLIAEVALVGAPNAGKSSLLKTVTSANPKIGECPFTTLYPNLGIIKYVDREIVLADIPGILEGASKGVGLGLDFLRHIKRSRCLVLLIESELNMESDYYFDVYTKLLHELELYDDELLDKPRLAVLSKSDLLPHDVQDDIVSYFKTNSVTIYPVSSHTHHGIVKFKDAIVPIL